jgi:hypothetical protein
MKTAQDCSSPDVVNNKSPLWGLVRRRQCLIPTWRCWLLIAVLMLGIGFFAVRGIYPFLASMDPITEGVLVVEGWTADYVLEASAAEFRAHHYDKLFVTGVPIEEGAPLVQYHTYAERGAAVLLNLGLSTNMVQAVPAPFVRQDRTYTTALALKKWCREHGVAATKLHLMAVGPHARRSRLLYQKAFGPVVLIGITSVPSKDYDSAHWWRYSAGFRNVTDECVAYCYARFLFHPRSE